MALPVDLSLSQEAVHFRGGFGLHRGRPGWEIDWDGFKVLALAAEAAKRGITEVSHDMAEQARHEHPWTDETFQTREAIFSQQAELEVWGYTPSNTPHVWGAWGVEDRPRFKHISVAGAPERDASGRFRAGRRGRAGSGYGGQFVAEGAVLETDEEESASTVDVAMFLEFGTVRMHPFPFLYPAWDAHKLRLAAVIRKHYAELAAMDWRAFRGPEFAQLRALFGPRFWRP